MLSIPDILLMLLISNCIPFVLMGADKRRARQGRRRIREAALLAAAAAFGGAGGWAGMYVFRHKTRKRKFCWGMPAILAGRAAILLALLLI